MASDVDSAVSTFQNAVPGEDVPAEDLCAALSHEYRREVLQYLVDGAPTVTLDELVGYLEANADGAAEEGSRRVALALHHAHLPKMADAGLVEYDPEEGRVSLSE